MTHNATTWNDSAEHEARSARTATMFERMREAGPEERHRLGNLVVIEHIDLADALARRFRRSGRDYSDLRQVALLGLIKAVRRFDPDHGTPFVPFAVPTVSGELKRHLRDHGWLIRPGRRLQQLCDQFKDARSALSQSLGRDPRDAELAAAMDVSVATVREVRTCLDAQNPFSVEPDEDDGWSWEATASDDDEIQRIDARLALSHALRSLTPREAYLVRRRFVDERTQAQIGSELGVTQMQVSRLLRKTLDKMRVELAGQETPTARRAA